MTLEEFEQHRTLLFSLAYRMLGTVSDAEDILQDAYLRIQSAATDVVEKPKAYLTTVVTRLCLNRLSAASRQREEYMGPWLPEPVETDAHPALADPLERVTLHDSISFALLVLLETLSPAERAVFLLHDVFDYKHKEIAAMLEKSEAACRQLCRRAKKHIAENRPRFDSDPVRHEQLLHGFIEVVDSGEIDTFLQILADDVTLIPDGGGERGAAIRVLRGREHVVNFILGVQRIAPPDLRYEFVTLNGQRALLARLVDGRPYFALFVYAKDDLANLLYVVAGRKLRHLQ
jgi:RNA polymerase sigma-70 factor (ECF subfamily)